VLLSLAGYQSANPSVRRNNDAFDSILPTKLPGPLGPVTWCGSVRHHMRPQLNELKPRRTQTSWSGHADTINYWSQSSLYRHYCDWMTRVAMRSSLRPRHGWLSALSCLFTNRKVGDERHSDQRICCVHRGGQVRAHEWCGSR
jgi:hypothetical protein